LITHFAHTQPKGHAHSNSHSYALADPPHTPSLDRKTCFRTSVDISNAGQSTPESLDISSSTASTASAPPSPVPRTIPLLTSPQSHFLHPSSAESPPLANRPPWISHMSLESSWFSGSSCLICCWSIRGRNWGVAADRRVARKL
jgi:hypothetical protein